MKYKGVKVMARPLKKGLEYFPLDVRIFRDDKIRDLGYKAGPIGELIYIRILTLIYENGYYIEASINKLAKIIHREIGPQWTKLERISESIHACLEVGLFDKTLAVQGVITSVSVQKQYLLSTMRRKDINITKYWLLEPSSSVERAGGSLSISNGEVNVAETVVNVDNNSVNVDISTQSKSKSKKDKDKEINIDKRAFGEPKLHFITKILIKNKYIESDDPVIGRFNLLAADLVDIHGFDLVLSVTDYILKMFKKVHINIDDKYDYFKVSAERNIKALEFKNNGGSFDIGKEIKDLIKTMGNND